MLEKTNLSSLKDVSNNLLVKMNPKINKSNYQMNHIKILDEDLIRFVKSYVFKKTNLNVEPFMMTNIGDVFFYHAETESVYLYYSRLNELNKIFSIKEIDNSWFYDVFLKDSDVQKQVFNTELFHITLQEDEILLCPVFLKEIPENYKVIKTEMAFHLFSEMEG